MRSNLADWAYRVWSTSIKCTCSVARSIFTPPRHDLLNQAISLAARARILSRVEHVYQIGSGMDLDVLMSVAPCAPDI